MAKTLPPLPGHGHTCTSCVYHWCPNHKCPENRLSELWEKWDGRGDGPNCFGSRMGSVTPEKPNVGKHK